MRDFLAAIGLLTLCALIGTASGLVRLWLSGREYRRVHRQIVQELSEAECPRWSSGLGAEPRYFTVEGMREAAKKMSDMPWVPERHIMGPKERARLEAEGHR